MGNTVRFTVGEYVWHDTMKAVVRVTATHIEPEYKWADGTVDAAFVWVDTEVCEWQPVGEDIVAMMRKSGMIGMKQGGAQTALKPLSEAPWYVTDMLKAWQDAIDMNIQRGWVPVEENAPVHLVIVGDAVVYRGDNREAAEETYQHCARDSRNGVMPYAGAKVDWLIRFTTYRSYNPFPEQD